MPRAGRCRRYRSRRTIVDPHVTVLDPSKLLESLAECGDEHLSFPVGLAIPHQHTDPSNSVPLIEVSLWGGNERRVRPGQIYRWRHDLRSAAAGFTEVVVATRPDQRTPVGAAALEIRARP